MNPPRHPEDETAAPGDFDPTHMIALAQRVQNLGESDDRLAERLEKLMEMLDKRLPTEEEMKSLREVLSDKAGREYLRKQFTRYGLGGLGLLATIYATRTYLSQFLGWLASVLK